MQIQRTNFPKFINFNGVNKLNYSNVMRNNFIGNKSATDTFIRNSSSISFAGETDDVSTTGKIMDGLKTAAFVGTPFLVMLGTTAALAKMQNPEDIFLSDGTYIGSASDFNMQSEYLNVDGDDGIFQVKNLGIDIRPERFNEIDIENGVYRNLDKGIDIDLLNNKYIDPENGIFVDPEHQVSAIVDGENIKHIAIPSFEGAWSPEGGGSVSAPYYMTNMSMMEDGVFNSLVDKIKAIIYITTGNEKFRPGYVVDVDGTRYSPQEWLAHQKDCFGREMIVEPEQGYLTSIPMDEKSQEIFKDFLNQGLAKEDALQIANNTNFDNFIEAKDIPLDVSFASAEGFDDDIADSLISSINSGVNLDMDVVDNLLEQFETNGELILVPNSYEAINFAIFQENLLEAGDIAVPYVDFSELLEPDTMTDALEELASNGLIDDVDSYLETLGGIIESMV